MFEYVGYGQKEPILYYLYMASDGSISYKEEKIFDVICEDLEIDSEEKKEIVAICKEALVEEDNVFSLVKSLIPSQKSEDIGYQVFFNALSSINKERVIWNLINLGYADSLYSEHEKEICDYLVKEWDFPFEIYSEFIDIADTMHILEEHKKWTLSTFPESLERDKKEREIDNDMKTLQTDVKIAIKEANM